MQGVDALLQDAASCSRASTSGIDSCFSMEVSTLKSAMQFACRLHVDRIFKMQIVFFQMQPACRSYYARMQPAYDGMQDAAGCSWSGVFNLLKFDRIAKKKKKKLHEPACRAHASLV